MSGRRLLAWSLAGYVALVAALAAVVWLRFRVDPDRDQAQRTVVTAWFQGRRVARQVVDGDGSKVTFDEAVTKRRGTTVVEERIVDRGPVLRLDPLTFCWSFAAGRDGVLVSYEGRELVVTRDDLLQRGWYGTNRQVGPFLTRCGIDPEPLLQLVARELRATPEQIWDKAELRRAVFKRRVRGAKPAEHIEKLTPEQLEKAVLAAATYLARNLKRDGSYRYEVELPRNAEVPGYNWPRHSGATLFLAEAAGRFRKPELIEAARRAAQHLVDHTLLRCGQWVCVGQGDRVDLGSSALALLAFAEIVRFGLDDSFKPHVASLTEFLRGMQRPDGEFKHLYDRAGNRAEDVQLPYYTGEAALALGRAHRITNDPRDLEAARKALAYTANERWTFFGSRYYFDSEHWTCQALEELWARAPDHGALEFCLAWQEWNRALQVQPSAKLGDYAGGFANDPLFPPRLTPAGSRTEGAAATLTTAVAAGVDADEIRRLEEQVDSALRFVIRHQFTPGPAHLVRHHRSAWGAIPGSPTELKVRIDYPQHAGSAMIRYYEYLQRRAAPKPSAALGH